MPPHPRAGVRAQHLGENVRQVRDKRGLSQRALAAQMGAPWTQQIIAKLERAEVGMRVEQLLDLCDALGTTVARLLRGVRGVK